MPRIHLASFQPADGSSPAAPRVDANALNAEFEARRNLASAVGGAVASGAEAAYRIRRAREDASRDMLELKLRTGLGDFVGELAAKNDTQFDTWGARWEKRMSDILRDSGASEPRMTGAGRRDFNEMTNRFKVVSGAQIADVARRKELFHAEKLFRGNLDVDIRAGDEESAVARIEAAAERGLISAEVAELEKSTLPARVQEQQFYKLRNSDPRRALALVSDPGAPEFAALDARKRAALVAVAEGAVNRERANLFAAIGRFVSKGIADDNPEFNALLDRAVATEPDSFPPSLAQRVKLHAMRKFEAVKPKGGGDGGPSLYETFVSRLGGYDPNNLAQRAGLLELMAAMPVGDQLKATRLFGFADKDTSPLKSAVGQAALKRLDHALGAGVFGTWTEFDPERDSAGNVVLVADPAAPGRMRPLLRVGDDGRPVKVTNVARFNEAHSMRAEVEGALIEFLGKRPDAGPDDVSDFIGGYIELMPPLEPPPAYDTSKLVEPPPRTGWQKLTGGGKDAAEQFRTVPDEGKKRIERKRSRARTIGEALKDDPETRKWNEAEGAAAKSGVRPGTPPDERDDDEPAGTKGGVAP